MQKKKSGFKLFLLTIACVICLAIGLPSVYMALSDNLRGSLVGGQSLGYASDLQAQSVQTTNTSVLADENVYYKPNGNNSVVLFSSNQFKYLPSYDVFDTHFDNYSFDTVVISDDAGNKNFSVLKKIGAQSSQIRSGITSLPYALEVGNNANVNNYDAREFAIEGTTSFLMFFNFQLNTGDYDGNLKTHIKISVYDSYGAQIQTTKTLVKDDIDFESVTIGSGSDVVNLKVEKLYLYYFYADLSDSSTYQEVYLTADQRLTVENGYNNHFVKQGEELEYYSLSGDYLKHKYIHLELEFDLSEASSLQVENNLIDFEITDSSLSDSGVSADYLVDVFVDQDAKNLGGLGGTIYDYQNLKHTLGSDVVLAKDFYTLREKFEAEGVYNLFSSKLYNPGGARKNINLEFKPRLVNKINVNYISSISLNVSDGMNDNSQRFEFRYNENALAFNRGADFSVSTQGDFEVVEKEISVGESTLVFKVYLNIFTHELEVEIEGASDLSVYDFVLNFRVGKIASTNIFTIERHLTNATTNQFSSYLYRENVTSKNGNLYKSQSDLFNGVNSSVSSNDIEFPFGVEDLDPYIYSYGSTQSVEFITTGKEFIFDKVIVKDTNKNPIFTIYGGLYLSDGTNFNYYFNNDAESVINGDYDNVIRCTGNYAYYIKYNDANMNKFTGEMGLSYNNFSESDYYANNFFRLNFSLNKSDQEAVDQTPTIQFIKENVNQDLFFDVSTQIFSLLTFKEDKAQTDSGVNNYVEQINQEPYSSVSVNGKTYFDDLATFESELLLGYAIFGDSDGADYIVTINDKYMFVESATNKTKTFLNVKGFKDVVAVARSTNVKTYVVIVDLQNYNGDDILVGSDTANKIVNYLNGAVSSTFTDVDNPERKQEIIFSYTDDNKLASSYTFYLLDGSTVTNMSSVINVKDASFLNIKGSYIRKVSVNNLGAEVEVIEDNNDQDDYPGVVKTFANTEEFTNNTTYKIEVHLTLRFMFKENIKVKYADEECGTIDVVTGFSSDYLEQEAKVYYYKTAKPESGAHSSEYLLNSENIPEIKEGVFFAGLGFFNEENKYVVNDHSSDAWTTKYFKDRFFVGDFESEKFAMNKSAKLTGYEFIGCYNGAGEGSVSEEYFNARAEGETIKQLIDLPQATGFVYVLTGYEKYLLKVNYIDQENKVMGTRTITISYALKTIKLDDCSAELKVKLSHSSLVSIMYNGYEAYGFGANVNPVDNSYDINASGWGFDLNSLIADYGAKKNALYDCVENNVVYIKCKLNEYDFGVWIGSYNEYGGITIPKQFKTLENKVVYGSTVNFADILNYIVSNSEDAESIEDLVFYRGGKLVGFVPVYEYALSQTEPNWSTELTQTNIKKGSHNAYLFVNELSEIKGNYIASDKFMSTSVILTESSVFGGFNYTFEGLDADARSKYAIMFIPVFQAKTFDVHYITDLQFGSFEPEDVNGTVYNPVKGDTTETLTIPVKFASLVETEYPIPVVVGGYIFVGYKLVLESGELSDEYYLDFSGYNSTNKAQSLNTGELVLKEILGFIDKIDAQNPIVYRWDMVSAVSVKAVYIERPIVINFGGIIASDYASMNPEDNLSYDTKFDFSDVNVLVGDNSNLGTIIVKDVLLSRNLWTLSTENFGLDKTITLNGFMQSVNYADAKIDASVYEAGFYLSRFVIKYYYYDLDEEGRQTSYIVEIEVEEGVSNCVTIAEYKCDITGKSVLMNSFKIGLGNENIGVNFNSTNDTFRFKLLNLLQMTELTDKNVYMLEVGCVFDELNYVVSFNPRIYSMDKGEFVDKGGAVKGEPVYYLVPYNGREYIKNWKQCVIVEEKGYQFALVEDETKTLFDFALEMIVGDQPYLFEYDTTIYNTNNPFVVNYGGVDYYFSHWISQNSGFGANCSGVLPDVLSSIADVNDENAYFDITKLETPDIKATGMIQLYPVFLLNTSINAQYYTWNTLAGATGENAYNLFSSYGAGFNNNQITSVHSKIPYNIYKMSEEYYFIDHWFGIVFKYIGTDTETTYADGVNAILSKFASGNESRVYTSVPVSDLENWVVSLNADLSLDSFEFEIVGAGFDTGYKIYPGQKLKEFDNEHFTDDNEGAVYYFVMFGVYEKYEFSSSLNGGEIVVNANLPSTPEGHRYGEDGLLDIEYVFAEYEAYNIAKNEGDIRFADGLQIESNYVKVEGDLNFVDSSVVLDKYKEVNAGNKRIFFAVVMRRLPDLSRIPYFALPLGTVTPEEIFRYGVYMNFGEVNSSAADSKYTSILSARCVDDNNQVLKQIDFKNPVATSADVNGVTVYSYYLQAKELLAKALTNGEITDDGYHFRLLVVEIACQLMYYCGNGGNNTSSSFEYGYYNKSNSYYLFAEHYYQLKSNDSSFNQDVSVKGIYDGVNFCDIETVITAINSSTETTPVPIYTDCLGFIRMVYTLASWSVCESIGVGTSNLGAYDGSEKSLVGHSWGYTSTTASQNILFEKTDGTSYNYTKLLPGDMVYDNGPGGHGLLVICSSFGNEDITKDSITVFEYGRPYITTYYAQEDPTYGWCFRNTKDINSYVHKYVIRYTDNRICVGGKTYNDGIDN